jgi:hypothetical protein
MVGAAIAKDQNRNEESKMEPRQLNDKETIVLTANQDFVVEKRKVDGNDQLMWITTVDATSYWLHLTLVCRYEAMKLAGATEVHIKRDGVGLKTSYPMIGLDAAGNPVTPTRRVPPAQVIPQEFR